MPNYNNSKIYTIRCKNDATLIYVGSTTQPLSERFSDHKTDSKKKEKYPNHKLYSKVQDWDDWYIELYQDFPCNSVQELRKKEGEIIREIATLNRFIAGRTKLEYYEDNKEYIKEYSRIYRATKRDKTIIYCDCGGTYQNHQKNRHKATKMHQNFLITCGSQPETTI